MNQVLIEVCFQDKLQSIYTNTNIWMMKQTSPKQRNGTAKPPNKEVQKQKATLLIAIIGDVL